ncbi:MAG: methionine--tRNA ligase, partial [Dietzia sp.]
GTVLHTALQVVSDANTLLTPYLPSAAQQIHGAIGGQGVWAAAPQVHEVTDDMPVELVGEGLPAAGRTYPVIMGDYAAEQARWGRTEITPGTPLAKPSPLFAKVDPELAETGPEWAPIQLPTAGGEA